MSVSTAKFTLEQYEHMVDCGAFGHPYEMRVELLNGEIVEMSPIGTPHADLLSILVDWSVNAVDRDRLIVRPQCPIRLPAIESEPEPDIAWVKRQSYRSQHPGPDDTVLVIEVADSSLAYDRGEKLQAYASAGIRDYWIVNLVDRQVEVYREPAGDGYTSKEVFHPDGHSPCPLAAVEARLAVKSLFA
ncbi:MAG: Uma2 family endonuclease [Planctomycetota bacterium]